MQRRMKMYRYRITLTDGSLLMATSDYSVLYTMAQELKEGISLFLHIGNLIVRKLEIKSIEEVKIKEEVKDDE
jgi:hypothetical protein